MDAKKVLGLERVADVRLSMKEKIAINVIREALDHGASFKDADRAWQWYRNVMLETILILGAGFFLGFCSFVAGVMF